MLSHISFGSLLLILLIVMVLFGTQRLANIGSDLGAAVRGFREGLQGSEPKKDPSSDTSRNIE